MMRLVMMILGICIVGELMAEDRVSASAELSGKGVSTDWFAQLFGVGMWPLWILSVVLVTLVFERKRSLRRETIIDDTVLDKCIEALGESDVDGAIEIAAASPARLCTAWAQGLMAFKRKREPIASALTTTSTLALKPLRRNVMAITTIGVVAPLLGLLGTVIGMIMTFGQIEATGGADKAALAGGISVALFTTAGGLVVAIPAIVAGRYFNNRIVNYAEEIELAINRADYCYDDAQHKQQNPEPDDVHADSGGDPAGEASGERGDA